MFKACKTLSILLVAFCLVFTAMPAMANTTVTGEVGGSNDIIAEDGSIYIIAESEKGLELSEMVGETVQVTGTVQEEDGQKVITVDSFTVVNK